MLKTQRVRFRPKRFFYQLKHFPKAPQYCDNKTERGQHKTFYNLKH